MNELKYVIIHVYVQCEDLAEIFRAYIRRYTGSCAYV